jgi:hypothetical protein
MAKETAPELDRPAVVMQATSAAVDGDGDPRVALWWEPHPDAVGYNLYRASGAVPARRPQRPINGGRPLEPVSTCAQLKLVVPAGSPEWDSLTSGFTALAVAADPAAEPIDPCSALERGLTESEERLFDTLAGRSLNLRIARGLAFLDRGVHAGAHHVYELRGVRKDGGELVLATGVVVWVGHFVLPDPPSGLVLQAGDHRVLALWNRNPYAYSYAVQRSTSPGGPFQAVNPKPVGYDVDTDLDGQPVSPRRPGFLDFQRWDADGLPQDHVVDGATVTGPENGTAYYFRVASCDVLGRLGSWSAALPATPQRSTPPMAPDGLAVSPRLAPPGLVLSWRKVTRDIDNHQLPDATQTYFIYRSTSREDLEDLSGLPARQVKSLPADPQDPVTPTLSWTDSDPILLPPYGETTFFYRLRCSDPAGRVSDPSAVIGGRIPDTTAPGPTVLDGADASDTFLRVYWKQNSEPDLAGYLIYRGVCDRGVLYIPGAKGDDHRGKCDVTLVGQVSLADAEAMLKTAPNRISFDDHSVPEGSPVCYAYWVRAYDVAQNLYDGNGGCPATRQEYVCVRLREKTPPPAPVVTALRARNRGVQVEWIASPVQDLRAFHVYRSDKELDPPTFLACVLTDGTVSHTRWPGMTPSCADIPAEPDPLTARGHYLDPTAVPQEIYWYRVSALDWVGNESEGAHLERLPSSSTFTYTRDLPVTPTVLPPTGLNAVGCGLDVKWGPAFDPSALEGFVVFRSAAGGHYRQVSAVLPANAFTDPSARRGVDYWYRVQSVDTSGRLSEPSIPVLHRY